MSKELYKNRLIQTVEETYPKYYKQKILKQLENDGLVFYSDQLLKEEGAVDLTGVEEQKQLETCINNSEIIIKKIEEFEFINSYKYSVILGINNFSEKSLELLLTRQLVLDFQNPQFENDILFDDNSTVIIPTKYSVDDVIIFKFSRLLTGYLPSGDKREIKYPILAILYQDINVLEIRFEKAKGFLKNNDEYFYVKQIQLIRDWFEEQLGWELEAIDLAPVVEHISHIKPEEVYVSAKAMNFKSKKKAVLDTGDNDEDVLPLLGELKELIKANEELFEVSEETKEIKKLLENFILETEETSDLPWISLTWKNESKSKATRVKFSFYYMNQDYSLLQYYYGNKAGMERMNNVTRYLIENKRALDEEFNEESKNE